jgi:hypothetical protein
MAQKYYSQHKNVPLTEDEIKEKYKEAQEEMKEVLKWKKEEEAKLENLKLSPQKKGAAKRALKKVAWRINTVQGHQTNLIFFLSAIVLLCIHICTHQICSYIILP